VIWPELVCLLTEAGVANYSIHFDQETSILFAFLERGKGPSDGSTCPTNRSCAAGGDHMRAIMRTHPDGSPVSIPLTEMIHLP
jgi:L-rhamnose mutarotase